MLIVLDSNPPVIVSVGGIIWKNQRRLLILQMNHPVRIVGGRIDHVTGNLFYGPVLAVSGPINNFLGKVDEFRFPFAYQSNHFV
jgi:hypothetical protein